MLKGGVPVAKKNEAVFVQAAKNIIEKKGQKFEAWKKVKITKRQFAILQGEDKEWEKSVIEEEMQNLVMDEIQKNYGHNQNNTQSRNQTTTA